ncbi:MAG TPA: type II toxin-antitoxin system death-on-curing family toxin [Micropepsaceae bacterium]|nr:type II toxin-antitoxin system death-on-curing family toxin [Micropepsaceae bacterium]
MKEPHWLNPQALERLHAMSIARDGGIAGLRDRGALESALARARNLFHLNGETDVCVLAAAGAIGICRNHPFADGNKRMAFAAIGVFLGLNGFSLEADKVDATLTIVQLAAGEMDEQSLVQWIRQHAKPR